MSAHVSTMRRQGRQQDEQQKNSLKKSPKLIIRSRVNTERRLTAALSSTNQRAESKGKMLAFTRLIDRREAFPVHQLSPNVNPLNTAKRQVNVYHRPDTHVIVVCAVHTRPSTDSRALLTNQVRTCIMSLSQGCSNVVLPFLHTVRTFPSY